MVVLARLVKVRGNRGELAAEPMSHRVERLEELEEVVLRTPEGTLLEPGSFQVEEVWRHAGRVIFKFQGIDSISEAERLRGAHVCVPGSSLEPLPAGEYYHSDLVGCRVVLRAGGEQIGVVSGLIEQGETAVLEIDTGGSRGPVLIPLARAICVEIDVDARRIVVDPPEGLLDLNR